MWPWSIVALVIELLQLVQLFIHNSTTLYSALSHSLTLHSDCNYQAPKNTKYTQNMKVIAEYMDYIQPHNFFLDDLDIVGIFLKVLGGVAAFIFVIVGICQIQKSGYCSCKDHRETK